MLNATIFNGNTPCQSSGLIMTYLSDLEDDLWDMATTVSCSTLSKKADCRNGSFSLSKDRHVIMYDTCAKTLYNDHYIFRMRRNTDATSHDDWEGTLKARSSSESITNSMRPNVNKCCGSCDGGIEENKFEEDINLDNGSKYSFSQKCRIKASKNINKIGDVTDTWPDMEDVYDRNDQEEALVKVGEATECVYKGFDIEFDGNEIGEFAVTLWYDSPTSSNPALAEISFSMDNPATDEAECFWDAMNNFAHVDGNSFTKTAWIYNGFPGNNDDC